MTMSVKCEIHKPGGGTTPGTAGASPQECAGCGKKIQERYLLKALDMFWHEDCLKCGCCDCRLGEVGSTLYTKGNLILCKRDYLRLFGTTGYCSACNKVIPAFEMVMRARANVYHLECFACQQCNHRFCVGDRFFLCDNKILCEYDYEERMVFANLAYNSNNLAQMKQQAARSVAGTGNKEVLPPPASLGRNVMHGVSPATCLHPNGSSAPSSGTPTYCGVPPTSHPMLGSPSVQHMGGLVAPHMNGVPPHTHLPPGVVSSSMRQQQQQHQGGLMNGPCALPPPSPLPCSTPSSLISSAPASSSPSSSLSSSTSSTSSLSSSLLSTTSSTLTPTLSSGGVSGIQTAVNGTTPLPSLTPLPSMNGAPIGHLPPMVS